MPIRPEPPRPGLHRKSVADIIEINLPATEPPPALPAKPPKEYAAPRPRLDTIRDSHEISVDTILTELAGKAEEARAAKVEAEALRAALEASKKAPPVIGSLTPPPDRKAFLKLAYALGTGLAGLITVATVWLGAHTAKVESKTDATEEKRQADKVVTAPLPEKVQAVERSATDCRTWAAATDDYYRQVFGKAGILIPPQPNAKPVTPIETRAPRRKPNTIGNGIVLEVLTPPPPLP